MRRRGSGALLKLADVRPTSFFYLDKVRHSHWPNACRSIGDVKRTSPFHLPLCHGKTSPSREGGELLRGGTNRTLKWCIGFRVSCLTKAEQIARESTTRIIVQVVSSDFSHSKEIYHQHCTPADDDNAYTFFFFKEKNVCGYFYCKSFWQMSQEYVRIYSRTHTHIYAKTRKPTY